MTLPFEVWASPEPTVARIDARTTRDQLDETGHAARAHDLDLLASLGVRATRYPVLWERCAPDSSSVPDVRWARERLEHLRTLGIEPIVTLLHHGSGPYDTSLVDPTFPERFARYAGAIAAAFPWVKRWTPINEPLTTARFSTLYGHWYPNTVSDVPFGAAITNEALAMQLGMAAIRAHVPDATFVLTEDLQSFSTDAAALRSYVAHKRERMYLAVDLVSGRVSPGHPLFAYLRERARVAPDVLARLRHGACAPDLIAWNYYPNSERVLRVDADGRTCNEAACDVRPISPLPLLRAAYERLRTPFGLGEVHAHGDDELRADWLRARTRDLCALANDGLPVRALGAWAAFGSVDWRSLLTRREGAREDGVFTFAGPGETPQETAVSREVRAMVGSVTGAVA